MNSNEIGNGIQEILEKKLVDHQMFYLVRKQGVRKWVCFEEIKHRMQVIAQFEKRSNNKTSSHQFNENHPPVLKSPHTFQQKIANLRKKKSSTEKKIKSVENIIFINQLNSSLIFRVIFTDKSEKIMNNEELKELYPQQLISFYENNLMVREQPLD